MIFKLNFRYIIIKFAIFINKNIKIRDFDSVCILGLYRKCNTLFYCIFIYKLCILCFNFSI